MPFAISSVRFSMAFVRSLGGLAAAAAVSSLPSAPRPAPRCGATPTTTMCEAASAGGGRGGGALYLSSGPSGAGKDTLLLGARANLRTEEVCRMPA